MLQICKTLFGIWNDKQVRYCHWKSNEHLMEGLDGETDLDVYVHPEDQVIAEEGLKKAKCIKFRTQAGSDYPMVDEWIGFDVEKGNLIHVHLHYRIITGTKFCKEYVFPVDDLIISSRVLDPDTNVYLTSPELEMIILYCRVTLKSTNKKKITSKGYDEEIAYLKERIDYNILHDYCVNLLGADDGEAMVGMMKTDKLTCAQWSDVHKIAVKWLTPYKTMSRAKCWFRTHYYWFLFFFYLVMNKKLGQHYINKKTLIPRGTSICFLGQDGSGKSTVSIQISKWLDWKIANHRFYLGSGEHYHSPLRALMNFVSKFRKKSAASTTNSAPKTNNLTSQKKHPRTLRQKIGMLMSCLEFVNISKKAYKNIVASNKYITKGGIAIFDRFPQNQFSGIYDGPKLVALYGDGTRASGIVGYFAKKESNYINKIQEHQPSLVFKLVLPPEESIRRKPFEDFEAVKIKATITEKLEFPKSTVHIIDATQDYNEEVLEIKRKIWNHLLSIQ